MVYATAVIILAMNAKQKVNFPAYLAELVITEFRYQLRMDHVPAPQDVKLILFVYLIFKDDFNPIKILIQA